jgi:hypothetical protein
MSENKKLMVLAFDNGEIQFRNPLAPNKYVNIKMHDSSAGQITSVKFDADNKFIMSSG